MALNVRIETPDTTKVVDGLEARNISFAQLEAIIQRVAMEALASMRDDLSSHVQTGLTIESTGITKVAQTTNMVSMFVGSQTRGAQLRWLDQGRGEVVPKHMTPTGKLGYLRFVLNPSGVLIFTRYARPTAGIGLIEKAASRAMSQVSNIIDSQLRS